MSMTNRFIPRLPTPAELDQLKEEVLDEWTGGFPASDEREEAQDLIAKASIAVFDGYSTDAPGYSGKLMCVIWSGAETFYEVYCWNEKHEIMHVNQDTGFFHEKDESTG
jgi:hypothetical protein